jgi:DNA-binding transcriptional LysR family regulator
LESLRQRKLDVGLLRPFPGSLPSDCTEIAVAHDRLMLVLPASHPQTQASKVPLSTLVDDKFIALSCRPGATLYAHVMRLWEKSGVRPRIVQEAANGPTLIALVAAGLGFTILPSSFQAVRFDRVAWKTIDTEDRWTESSLNLVFRKDILAERIPARFIECLREHSPAPT